MFDSVEIVGISIAFFVIVFTGLMFWFVLTRKGVDVLAPIRDFATRHKWQLLTSPYFGMTVHEWKEAEKTYQLGGKGILRNYRVHPRMIAFIEHEGHRQELIYASVTVVAASLIGEGDVVGMIFFRATGLPHLQGPITLSDNSVFESPGLQSFKNKLTTGKTFVDSKRKDESVIYSPEVVEWYNKLDRKPWLIQREGDTLSVVYPNMLTGVRVADDRLELLYSQFQQALAKLS